MKLFLAIIVFLSITKNTTFSLSFNKDTDTTISLIQTLSNLCEKLNIFSQKNSEADIINLWKIDSFFRGANIHPYMHFSPFSMRNPITEKDLIELKKLGANLVVANYTGVFTYFPPYQIDSLSLANLDNIVNLTEKLNLFLVISLRSGPGRSLYSFFDKYREDEFLFYDSLAQEKYIEMCRFISERYSKKKHLVGINFLLEPHGDDPVNLEPIKDSIYFNFVEKLIREIRKVNCRIPIIVQPQGWAYPDKFTSLKKFDDEKIVYSFDMYFPHSFTNEKNDSSYPGFYFDRDTLVFVDSIYLEKFLKPVIDFKNNYNVPIFVNEYGGIRYKKGILNYLKDLHEIFLKFGFHFAFYVWKSDWGETDGRKFDEYNYEKGIVLDRDQNSDKDIRNNELLEELKRVWKTKRND